MGETPCERESRIPGRFSLRTLDIVRNLSSEEAILFREVCGFVLEGTFLFNESEFFHKASDLALSDLLPLVDAGLLQAGDLSARFFVDARDEKEARIQIKRGSLRVILEGPPAAFFPEPWSVRAIRLTTAGGELLSLQPEEPDPRLLTAFAAWQSGPIRARIKTATAREGSTKLVSETVLKKDARAPRPGWRPGNSE